jgi:hypothetical protein
MNSKEQLQSLHFDTLSQGCNELGDLGYTEQFESTKKGIRAINANKYYSTDDVRVVNKFRFEGMSNPADNTLLIALKANDGTRGTLVMSYGGDHFQDIDTIKEIEGHSRV